MARSIVVAVVDCERKDCHSLAAAVVVGVAHNLNS